MSEFLSIKDLINQVKEKIPKGSPIPSPSTVFHFFAPPNMYAETSQYFTGKTNLKFVVQRSQLRVYHIDAHWCYALFRYLREMMIMYRDKSLLLFCDNKAKIDFGEPAHAFNRC